MAFPCNLEIDGLWGYFIGPEKKHIAVELNKEVLNIIKNSIVKTVENNNGLNKIQRVLSCRYFAPK